VHISPYTAAVSISTMTPGVPRKLLLHRQEIRKLGLVEQQGLTLAFEDVSQARLG